MRKLFQRVFGSSAVLLSLMLLVACGEKETLQPSLPGGKELAFLSAGEGADMELTVETGVLFDAAPELKGAYGKGKFLGMQFYQGEPVQLWASAPGTENGQETVTVYMYRQDGSREECIGRVDRQTGQSICFRDSQGFCYGISRGGEGDNDSIVKLDGSGRILYSAKIKGERGRVERLCELPDGCVAALARKSSGRLNYGIVLLDDKGNLTDVELPELAPGLPCYMGTSEDALMLISQERLYRVGLSDGKLEPLFSFVQTAYTVSDLLNPVAAFFLGEDGRLEVLRADLQNSRTYETLSWKKKAEGRQEVILRAWSLKNNSFLKDQVMKFNSSSEKYQVVLEGPGEGEGLDEYSTRTGVELATGNGPDILEKALIEAPGSLIEKGMLADLAPFMKRDGIQEEGYFPVAFDTWRTGDSIYNVWYAGSLMERTIASAVLGDAGKPSIEAVADALLAYPENAVYDRGYSGTAILRELLEGSETLWGMVDWEKGACDFGGELFGKLLEAAKRYQYDAGNNYAPICSYRDFYSFQDIYRSPSWEEAMAGGNVPVGQLFDDGAHPVGLGFGVSFSVNANSANREGAWEFLRFLLSADVQESLMEDYNMLPVMKSVFWAVAEEEILHGPTEKYGKGLFAAPLSREKAEEVAALMESTRALPYKTEAILEIVLEESQAYFGGSKEIPQVAEAVENRVGLYLKERN